VFLHGFGLKISSLWIFSRTQARRGAKEDGIFAALMQHGLYYTLCADHAMDFLPGGVSGIPHAA